MTYLWPNRQRNRGLIRGREDIFLFSRASRPALVFIKLLIQLVQETSSTGLKWLGRETEHTSLTSMLRIRVILHPLPIISSRSGVLSNTGKTSSLLMCLIRIPRILTLLRHERFISCYKIPSNKFVSYRNLLAEKKYVKGRYFKSFKIHENIYRCRRTLLTRVQSCTLYTILLFQIFSATHIWYSTRTYV
jgi:DNA-directed RNA polymerase subunit N (RpoN/RPB10)